MVKAIIAFVLISFTTTTSTAQDFEYNVLYDSDKSKIRDVHQSELKELFKNTSIQDIERIALIGHTDSDASEAYNLNLSKERVQGVKAFLLNNGIPEDLIYSTFVGEQEPRESNSSAEGKQANRRVQMKLFLKPILHESVEIVEKVNDCLEDTVITLPQGTRYKINKCFYLQNPDCVKIKEFYTAKALAEEGLLTVSEDGDQLISSGMMDYEVCDGIEVDIFIPSLGIPCGAQKMQRWEANEEGAWVLVSPNEVPVVQIADQEYFQLSVSGIGRLNMDVIPAPSMPPPKTRFKRKWRSGLNLKSVSVYCDCPLTGVRNTSKKGKGKKVIVDRTCCPSALVKIEATDKDGNLLEFETRPLSELNGNTFMGSCPTTPRSKFLFIRTRNKVMHRKYKISRDDFEQKH
ncbi:MAG: OmpA family protein [Fluviicola sp.]